MSGHWSHTDYRKAIRPVLQQPMPLQHLRAALEEIYGPSSPNGYDDMAVPYVIDCMVKDGHLLRVARHNCPAVYMTMGAGDAHDTSK